MEATEKLQEYFVTEWSRNELTVYHYGKEECIPSHSYGPAIRDHFLVHYIFSGKGCYQVDGKTYHLSEGQGFLICPEVLTFYKADEEEPWTYTWVGFKGTKAEAYLKQAGLDRENPILSCKQGEVDWCFEGMLAANPGNFGFELELQGYLSLFLAKLALGKESRQQGINQQENYVKRALKYIETNYSQRTTIDEMAKFLGLNKNYFSTLFKEQVGISPRDYLVKFRMEKACYLLENTDLSVNEVSRSVGYEDPLGFSKIFKKFIKISPRGYREGKDEV